ncbi:Hypothetical predicted protein [Mytilus galloprovincialis]|uniref:Uncharacterized protein n=1 Tax=Mytilus galloprovincialis TaxID=29158 RepID=A0A8B6F233_MYTGA|nr:Hypothetical predicted protein [Mytilus galloprovincialis]
MKSTGKKRMWKIQEESVEYPSRVVPSGTRYTETNHCRLTMVYEFSSTDPCDPRNCQIRLPLQKKHFGYLEIKVS